MASKTALPNALMDVNPADVLKPGQTQVRDFDGTTRNVLTAEEAIADVSKGATRKPYRAILAGDAPCHSLSLGVAVFQKITERRISDHQVVGQRGNLVYLSDEEIRRAVASAKFKFFRIVKPARHASEAGPAETGTAEEHDMRTPGTSPLKGDIPIMKYLLLEPNPEPEDYAVPSLFEVASQITAPPVVEVIARTNDQKKDEKKAMEAAQSLGLKANTLPGQPS